MMVSFVWFLVIVKEKWELRGKDGDWCVIAFGISLFFVFAWDGGGAAWETPALRVWDRLRHFPVLWFGLRWWRSVAGLTLAAQARDSPTCGKPRFRLQAKPFESPA
jgi:hypothetical protein